MAIAAPATPMFIGPMNSQSSTTFVMPPPTEVSRPKPGLPAVTNNVWKAVCRNSMGANTS